MRKNVAMVLEISSEVLRAILAEAASDAGLEVCGLLFGKADRVVAAQSCRNVAADPRTAFEIDPAALIATYRQARNDGLAVIGHYHSHPTGLPEPSTTDAANAMGDGAIWLILGGGAARAWRTIERGAFVALPLVVNPPTAPARRVVRPAHARSPGG